MVLVAAGNGWEVIRYRPDTGEAWIPKNQVWQRIGEGAIERYPPGSPTARFYDVDYKIPAEVVKEKQKVTVRFQATGGNETPAVFGIRIVRAEDR